MNRDSTSPLSIDPGWLFLLAGLAVLGATLLIPAADELDQARWLRDRALTIESHRKSRITRYNEYVQALDSREPDLVLTLAASQLNQIPVDRGVIPGMYDTRTASISVFPALEPEPLHLGERKKVESRLARLATGEKSRLWMIAGGSLCVLVGLLPATRRRSPDLRVEH